MRYAIAIGLVIALALLGGFLFVSRAPAASLSSVRNDTAPWPTESLHLKERLAAIGLPALSSEGTVLHTHQHLDIFLDGSALTVPSGIGVHETFPSFISPIHTHDTSGIVHVESPTKGTFTLGQFFDIWGVRLTPTCIGGYCTDGTHRLAAYVNGKIYEGNLRDIVLDEHEEIAIVYGTAAEQPAILPMTYSFPEGY